MSYNTNAELRAEFTNDNAGERNHTGSMRTERLRNGDLALIGYDHCIYAERCSSTGEITVHRGWIDWALSQSSDAEATPRHIRRLEPLADSTTDRNPSAAATPDSVREIGRLGLRGIDPIR